MKHFEKQTSAKPRRTDGARPAPAHSIQRRQFLKSIAFTGAAGLILPRIKLFGADAPSNKLNIALMGTWGRAEAHFDVLSRENVVAICDVNEDHLAFGGREISQRQTIRGLARVPLSKRMWTPWSVAPWTTRTLSSPIGR